MDSLSKQILTPDATRGCESIVPLIQEDQRPVCSQRAEYPLSKLQGRVWPLLKPVIVAKSSKICIELAPLWDGGEAALESRDPHPRRATRG